jgi:acylphosphatase
MDRDEYIRLHAIVEGHVQGVSFRYYVQDKAVMLGVTGWVRNRWDGTVEVTAEDVRENLDKLLQALYQGPRASTVTKIKSEWQAATGEFQHFNIRMTSY